MSNEAERKDEQQPQQGINLALVYTLMAIALVAAMAVAGLIVAPFYLHRH